MDNLYIIIMFHLFGFLVFPVYTYGAGILYKDRFEIDARYMSQQQNGELEGIPGFRYSGEYGQICADGTDRNNIAQVVCSMYGYDKGESNMDETVSDKIWLTNVHCYGQDHLLDCEYDVPTSSGSCTAVLYLKCQNIDDWWSTTGKILLPVVGSVLLVTIVAFCCLYKQKKLPACFFNCDKGQPCLCCICVALMRCVHNYRRRKQHYKDERTDAEHFIQERKKDEYNREEERRNRDEEMRKRIRTVEEAARERIRLEEKKAEEKREEEKRREEERRVEALKALEVKTQNETDTHDVEGSLNSILSPIQIPSIEFGTHLDDINISLLPPQPTYDDV